MSKIKVTIAGVSENPTTNNTVIVKLTTGVGKVEVLPGVFKEKKSTYYMSVPAEAKAKLIVGSETDLNMALHNVVERPFEHPESGTIMLKWLHLK